ncbi:MAG: hypothetical protein HYX69_00220 [Planctomycetia bacterium]|nr:hypothetical protein [Planctomycetia bacterium]
MMEERRRSGSPVDDRVWARWLDVAGAAGVVFPAVCELSRACQNAFAVV